MKNIKNWILSPTAPTSTDVGWIKPENGEYRLYVRSGGKFVPCNPSIDSEEIINDYFTYGVSWKPFSTDPALTRVGNMQLHRDLPIQSDMKGCVVQCKDGVKIQYYLDPKDWRFKKEGVTKEIDSSCYKDTYAYHTWLTALTVTDDAFSTLQYEGAYIYLGPTERKKCNGQKALIAKIKSIDTSTKTATIDFNPYTMDGNCNNYNINHAYEVFKYMELGSVLTGYDGEVMVEVPEFWIKSWDTETKKEVRISAREMDGSWVHQPKVLIDAYHGCYLNSIPENMGYLSTLPLHSLVSICNTNTYCRGGSNSVNEQTTYDSYLETDPFYTLLGKPYSYRHGYLESFYKQAGKKMLSYEEYKNILFWLYVIEYANFDCTLPYNQNLTSEGYHQGGLGEGISTLKTEIPGTFTPNGYTNSMGNDTGTRYAHSSTIDETQYIPRWRGIENPFGDAGTCVTGLTAVDNTKKNQRFITFKKKDKDGNTIELTTFSNSIPYGESGIIKEYALGSTAEIVPISIDSIDSHTYKCCKWTDDYHGEWHPIFGPYYLQGNNCYYFSSDKFRLGSFSDLFTWMYGNLTCSRGSVEVPD